VDAIAAVATAPGKGGIGVVRVSAPELASLQAVCLRVLKTPLTKLAPRQAQYLNFCDASGEPLDRGLAIYFPAPHSYTGEHVLELQGHGGPILLALVLQSVLQCSQDGAAIRLAEPGEFTRRAFLNDKLDLAQAEGVADLIDASTEQAARSALRSLNGEFSSAIHLLVEQLINLRMLVEATLDFPEEDIDFLKAANASQKLQAISDQVNLVFTKASQGSLLREGMNVVLMGKPNVGKSSVLNALAGADVAIVTPIAGTTRDKVIQGIQIEGVPIHISDTAGLRQTSDEVEKIGIARTIDAITKADVVVWLLEAQAENDHETLDEMQRNFGLTIGANTPVLKVFNKIDLLVPMNAQALFKVRHPDSVLMSAKNGQGLDALRSALLGFAGWQQEQGVFLARERHLVAMRQAKKHVADALVLLNASEANHGLELIADELRLAQESLSLITGEFSADDLLGVIFSRFCIGK
jgi:tRNA modification GTPase